MASKRKRITFRGLLILFLVLAIFVIHSIGVKKIIGEISKANPYFVLSAFFALLLAHILNTIRWSLFLKPKVLKFPRLFLLTLAGAFITLITPSGGVGGEAVRGYYVSKIEKRSLTDSISVALIEKLVYGELLMAPVIIYSFIYIGSQIKIPIEIKAAFVSLIILISLVTAIALFLKHNLMGMRKLLEKTILTIYKIKYFKRRFKNFKSFQEKIHTSVNKFFSYITESIKEKKVFGTAIFLGSTSIFMFYLSFYLIFLSLDYPISISYLIVAISMAKLISLLSLLPGGVGLTESALFALFIALAIDPVIGVSVIIIQRAMYYLLGIGAGYSALAYLGLTHEKKFK